MPAILTEEDYCFLPAGEAMQSAEDGLFMHYVNVRWLVHPEKGLAFWNPVHARTGRRRHRRHGSPQCNTDKRIKQDLIRDCPWPDPEVLFLPSVWVSVDISDCRQ